MKKILLAITLIFSLCAFAACNGNENSDSGEALETEITTETTTETTTEATTEPEPESVWMLKRYVDEFDRPTSRSYISGAFEGTFSNSATSNSDLIVIINIDGDTVHLKLYEYGSHLANNPYSDYQEYKISILEDSGFKRVKSGFMMSKSDYIYTYDPDDARTSNENYFIKALKENDTLTVRVDEKDGMSSYLFDVDCTGFKELHDAIWW